MTKRWDDDAGTAVESRPEQKTKPKEPPLWKVLMHNDDFTTMDFVVDVLQTVFHKQEAEAVSLMQRVHREGIAQIGTYPHGLAQTKVERVHQMAERQGFPLLCTMEPE